MQRPTTLLKNISAEEYMFLLTREWLLRIGEKPLAFPDKWVHFFFGKDMEYLPKIPAFGEKLSVGLEGSGADLTPETLALVHENQSLARRTKGLYYTPWKTASLLSRQTLCAFLEHSSGITSHEAEMLLNGKNPLSKEKSLALDKKLSPLRVLDPAAGAGGLLIPFWLQLARLRTTLNPFLSYRETLLFILKNNLFAADKDPKALRTLRLRAGLTLLQTGISCPPKEILPNILMGDSLSTDSQNQPIWFSSFPQVFQEGGFGIILANPPYVGQKNNAELFKALRQNEYWKPRLTPKGDLLYLFFHLAIDLLRPQGIGGFLTTAYYSQAAGAELLRKRLRHETALLNLTDFGEERLFKQAQGQHSLLTVFQKGPLGKPLCHVGQTRLPQESLFSGSSLFLQIHEQKNSALESALAKMDSCPSRLKHCAKISNGLMTGCDKISTSHLQRFMLPNVQKGEGVFILSQKEKESLSLSAREENKIKPFFKNSDISPYVSSSTPRFFLIDFFCPQDRFLNPTDYPNIMAHLSRFKPVLLARKQNNNGIDKELKKGVYWLGSVRRKMNFEEEKLVVPHRSPVNTFAYAPGPWYASSDVYFISQPTEVSLWYLLGLFNSAPYYAWLLHRGKRKGRLLELYSAPLGEMPVPKESLGTQTKLESVAKEIFKLKKQNPQADISRLQFQADRLVCQIFGFTEEEQAALSHIYPPETKSKKI